MSDVQHRQQKIQEKRKKTPFREFVKEIVSWFPIVFHKTQGHMSRYPQTDRIGTLSSNQDFAAIRDTLGEYASAYDPQVNIFKQIHSLMKSIPLGATIRQMAGENTDYADSVVGSSHAYLSSAIINDCRDVLYSFVVFDYCKTVIDSLWVGTYSEDVYNSVGVVKSTNIFYSRYITNSSNIRFSVNLIGCHDCIGCVDLENASYCIKNEQYTKEAYEEKKQHLLQQTGGFERIIASLPIVSNNIGSSDVTGNHITMSTNVEQGYFVNRLEHGRNVICVGGENQEKNFYDMFDAGVNSHDMYANEGSGVYSNNVYCSTQVERCAHIFYSYYLVNCSYCFGCVGLQNKQYCILNKQYTKEAREQQVHEICTHMEEQGIWGDFFPGWMNPFYFNDTGASLIEEFTKEEVEAEGYLRRDEEVAVDIPEWMEVVEVADLEQYEGWRNPLTSAKAGHASSGGQSKTWRIDPAILKKVIRDEEGNVYRVIKMEYDFLLKHGLPLPRKHWLQRLKGHFRIK